MSDLVPIKPIVPVNKTAILPDKPVAASSLVAAPPVPKPLTPILVAPLPIAQTNNATLPVSTRTSATTTRKRSSIQTITILAGQTFAMAAYGNRWQLLSAPAPVPIRYDQTAGFSSYAPGLGLMIATEADFAQLEFENPYQFPLTLTVFFGWDEQAAFIPPSVGATIMEGNALVLGGVQTFGATALNVLINNTAGYTGAKLGHLFFRKGYFYGLANTASGLPPWTANAQNVYIGKTPAYQTDTISPGAWVEYEAPPGCLYDFGTFSFVGTATDYVFFSLTT